ncbi:Lumazine-binding protein [Fistulina hepatica ATCC 64428]|uniref:Riboflavin synthase n=1 Tax=Fistulina hepatica ATCC 64428 TaxID=1128425 RepID=A0A0D7AGJ6_9AGAR|nr:Lumazine-binding protein [Fistulina hepatica ATCC 64428]
MFTGLVEHLGTVSRIARDEGGCNLVISRAAPVLQDCAVGDSIAVSGTCLTVTTFDLGAEDGTFEVWLANETLDRTDLGSLRAGDVVNLERAMGAHVRFGGHFVQAHVDGTAQIVDLYPDGDSKRMTFELAPEQASLLRYIVKKGYVAIDGASLTVTGVDKARRRFSVMLIQHTQERITLGRKQIGATVNIEVDMLGKYVESSVRAALGGGDDEGGLRGMIEKVVEDVLAKKGIV